MFTCFDNMGVLAPNSTGFYKNLLRRTTGLNS
jgi:hypothetical protein